MSKLYCSVPGCKSLAKKKPELSFHHFPQKGKGKVTIKNTLGNDELLDRQEAWALRLKMVRPIKKHMVVCSLHFKPDDYLKKCTHGSRKNLKKSAVPSPLKSFTAYDNNDNAAGVSISVVDLPQSQSEERDLLKERGESSNTLPRTHHFDLDVAPPTQDDIQAAESLLLLLDTQPNYEGPNDLSQFQQQEPNPNLETGVQVNTLIKTCITVCDLIHTDKVLNTFTGMNSFDMLNVIVSILEKKNIDQRLHHLNIKARVILTFMKMKHNLSYALLGSLFGISPELTKNYIHTMLPILAEVLHPTINFASREEIQRNMPKYFEEFQNVRIVLDCTEIHIQKPKCLCCRIRFYSHYKNSETVKFLVGVSPGGLITYVSEPYGGRASDKLIFEESDLISKMEPHIDAIMVDKGFLIDDTCNTFNIKLIRPPFIKNKKQLSANDAILNAKIASARVHIERVNQRIKIFKILGDKLQWSLVPLINCIFTIACGITNLSAPILSDERFLKE